MKQWAKVCLALSLGLPLTACVDDSYDASKDIDMTMGLGSQGLQLKLGNTENIMLADLLEEDENLKTDAQHTYYSAHAVIGSAQLFQVAGIDSSNGRKSERSRRICLSDQQPDGR